jgi:hypothetical protein
MRLHVDLLGWLHQVWGAFGVLAGASLGLMAIGTSASIAGAGSLGAEAEHAAVWVFIVCGGALAAFGASMVIVGGALRRRRLGGRVAALVLAVPNLVLVPFGTALGVYTFWALLNDDARRQFGRPTRGVTSPGGTSQEAS